MNTARFLVSAWTWNPVVLLLCAAALAGYVARFGVTSRIGWMLAALAFTLVALLSPLASLAEGYLFSAHMLQHILLLLLIPFLVLRSLPDSFDLPAPLRRINHPLIGWLCGVGAMWLWHAPSLCNAAGASRSVYALQTITLLAAGTVFWWQTVAPRDEQRLSPPGAVIYLFTACLACSVLGMILTFSPVTVCSVYMHPVDRLGILSTVRETWGMNHARDQQVGGLLMWVPMCLVYLSAIFAQIARWYARPPMPVLATTHLHS